MPGVDQAADGLVLDAAFARLLAASHQRLTGRPLIRPEDGGSGEGTEARWLYHDAPFCLLAHDTGPDPRFIYANRAAQDCFGYGLDAFLGLPSRLSAEAPDRAERQRLLDSVARQGFIDDYRGVRVARSGRRFRIEQATVWMLLDEAGVTHGQAALFRIWHDLAEQAADVRP